MDFCNGSADAQSSHDFTLDPQGLHSAAVFVKGIICSMGRNDAECRTIDSLVTEAHEGKISITMAINAILEIPNNKQDYN